MENYVNGILKGEKDNMIDCRYTGSLNHTHARTHALTQTH